MTLDLEGNRFSLTLPAGPEPEDELKCHGLQTVKLGSEFKTKMKRNRKGQVELRGAELSCSGDWP